MREDFIKEIRDAMLLIYDINQAHGFNRTITIDYLGNKIALMHSELSEALEAGRKAYIDTVNPNPFLFRPSEHIPEFNELEEEFADVIIRVLGLSEELNLRLPEAIIAKVNFNKGREYKHGKNF